MSADSSKRENMNAPQQPEKKYRLNVTSEMKPTSLDDFSAQFDSRASAAATPAAKLDDFGDFGAEIERQVRRAAAPRSSSTYQSSSFGTPSSSTTSGASSPFGSSVKTNKPAASVSRPSTSSASTPKPTPHSERRPVQSKATPARNVASSTSTASSAAPSRATTAAAPRRNEPQQRLKSTSTTFITPSGKPSIDPQTGLPPGVRPDLTTKPTRSERASQPRPAQNQTATTAIPRFDPKTGRPLNGRAESGATASQERSTLGAPKPMFDPQTGKKLEEDTTLEEQLVNVDQAKVNSKQKIRIFTLIASIACGYYLVMFGSTAVGLIVLAWCNLFVPNLVRSEDQSFLRKFKRSISMVVSVGVVIWLLADFGVAGGIASFIMLMIAIVFSSNLFYEKEETPNAS